MSEMSMQGFETGSPAQPADLRANSHENARKPIGFVADVSGSGGVIGIDLARLKECMGDDDASVALSGQVGCPV
ncbi:ATPase, partial [Sphingomonas koreensis]